MIHRMAVPSALVAALISSSHPGAQPAAPPDLVIFNARVYTGDPGRPWAEAVRIRAARIDAVGTTAELRASAATAARAIDAGGRLLVPGFNDAHAHPGAMPPATRLEGPPAVEHDPTLDEVMARISLAVQKAPPGQWIVGEIGSAILDDPRAARAILDPLTPDRPLMLTAWTGHGSIFNTAGLRALNVSETEPDPAARSFRPIPPRPPPHRAVPEDAHYPPRPR